MAWRRCLSPRLVFFDFRFVLPLDRVTYAAQKVDFRSIYLPGSLEEVDLAGLRSRLEKLPCCTVNAAGSRPGDPLNLVVIGGDTDGIFPFIMRDGGWMSHLISTARCAPCACF